MIRKGGIAIGSMRLLFYNDMFEKSYQRKQSYEPAEIFIIKTSEISLKNQKDFLKILDVQYDNLSNQLTENQKLFQEIKAGVSPEKSEELFDERVNERDTIRDHVYQKLYATIGQKFNASLFHDSVRDIDNRLDEDSEAFRDRAFQKRITRELGRRKDHSVQKKGKNYSYER